MPPIDDTLATKATPGICEVRGGGKSKFYLLRWDPFPDFNPNVRKLYRTFAEPFGSAQYCQAGVRGTARSSLDHAAAIEQMAKVAS